MPPLNRSSAAPRAARPRRGAILIVTMLIVFSLASLVLVMGSATRVEVAASANAAAALQAAAIERGAEQYAIALLTEQPDDFATLDDTYFAARPVGDGYFWLCRPDFGDAPLKLFGLLDEGAKLNLNTADADALLKLPNMTTEVANSIVAWRSPGDTAANGGAKSSYYGSLPNPYQCKNGPFETVEEVLLVQGVSRELLYGNALAPPLGTAANTRSAAGAAATDLQTARGLLDLLTVYSKEAPEKASGAVDAAQPAGGKVNLATRADRNQALAKLLTDKLPSRAAAILAIAGSQTYDDAFQFAQNVKLTAEELDLLFDSLTVTPQNAPPADQSKGRQGLINVNTAPRDVLLCLGDLTSADVDKLLATRQSNPDGTTTVGWVLTALGDRLATLRIGNRICGKSGQYTADVVAVSGNGRAFKHVRVVIDASGDAPRILYRRDFTDRGWPMDPQILESLRAGRGIAQNARGPQSGGTPGGITR